MTGTVMKRNHHLSTKRLPVIGSPTLRQVLRKPRGRYDKGYSQRAVARGWPVEGHGHPNRSRSLVHPQPTRGFQK